jgi:hypothetical protein
VIKHRKILFVYNDPPRGQARPDNKIEELQKRLVINEGGINWATKAKADLMHDPHL